MRSISAAPATGSHSGMIIVGMKRPGNAAPNSSSTKSFHALTQCSAKSLSLASWNTWPQ